MELRRHLLLFHQLRPRRFPQMLGGAMNPFQERHEAPPKREVAFAAAEAPYLFEILIGQTALRALLLGCQAATRALNRRLDIRKSGQKVPDPEMLLDIRTFLFRARLAKIELRDLLVDDLGQMDRRFIFPALVTKHQSLTPPTLPAKIFSEEGGTL